ncbi:U3 small nucleolar RNA-associated protein 13 [Pleurotus pulmonarius]|nr:U3 small nucleolar RNA-associated protein 13 [Pleurotus pulmonarius]KAF4606357.1 U3 small nucleolar RNA-associated protein 13 [Pleurotus pulmonarius]
MTVPPPRPKLKTSFKKSRTISPLYTSGPVAVSVDGSKLFTTVADEVICTDVASGNEICRFAGDTQSVLSLCVSPSSDYIVVFTTSSALKVYNIPKESNTAKPVQPIRVIARAHDSPVHVCKIDPTSTYLASGAADGVVKVWDVSRGYVTHAFKGHGGVVSALAFNYPRDNSSVTENRTFQLITASNDTRIRIFDLMARSAGGAKPEAVLEGHVSVPRGLDVSSDGRWLVSGGRDSVVLVWDLAAKQPEAKKSNKDKGKHKAQGPVLFKTIPILERVEAVGILRDEDSLATSSSSMRLKFFTAGQQGIVKIWDAQEGQVLFTLGTPQVDGEDAEEQRQILDAMYIESTSTIVSVHGDQNILFFSLATRSLSRQCIGYNDEIVDACFLSPEASSSSSTPSPRDTHIALATNSSLIRIYNNATLDARLLSGHSEIVLCLDRSANGNLLASGSKDRTARIWAPSQSSSSETDFVYGCVAVCEGHAESIGALSMSRGIGTNSNEDPRFMFTGSQDRTIKMWDLTPIPQTFTPPDNDEDDSPPVLRCKSLTTHKAHDKDINSLDIAPNNRFLASGSQDRTAKVFEIEFIPGREGRPPRGELKLLGICKGHKRGVWTVRFSRHERLLATGSGDKTIKLWSLEDWSCVKTFEGHTNSVLRVDFINAGMQLVSSASDGLVKLWNVKDEECTATMDNHEDKVWALAVSSDDKIIVSGAADSVVTFWEDCTEEEELEKEAKRTDQVLKEQEFMNYLSLNDYRKAIQLAILMEQPGRLYKLFKEVHSNSDPETVSPLTGHSSVDEVIKTLSGSDLAKLLRFVRAWNANAKSSEVAQTILYSIVKLRSAEDVMSAFGDEMKEEAFITEGLVTQPGGGKAIGGSALKELIDGLVPYTERHLARIEKLVQESYMIDYILGEMDDGMFDNQMDGAMDVDV